MESTALVARWTPEQVRGDTWEGWQFSTRLRPFHIKHPLSMAADEANAETIVGKVGAKAEI